MNCCPCLRKKGFKAPTTDDVLYQALLQAIQGDHGGQDLGDAGVGFAALSYGRKKFAVLKLDAVAGDRLLQCGQVGLH